MLQSLKVSTLPRCRMLYTESITRGICLMCGPQVQQFEGGFDSRYDELLDSVVGAEAELSPLAESNGALDPYQPTMQEQMECQELTGNALTTLPFPDGQTYALSEEDVAVNQIVLSANRARAMCVTYSFYSIH